jgi:hypothetical protein
MLRGLRRSYCLATFGARARDPSNFFNSRHRSLGIAFPIILLAFLYVRDVARQRPRVA